MPDRVVAPSRDDPLARQAAQVVGGPLGRYAVPLVRGWRWYAAVLTALTALPVIGSLLLRGYCIEGGWRTPDQFTHMCFTDLSATFAAQHLGGGLSGFLAGGLGSPTPPHPPLTALVMTALGGIVPIGTAESRAQDYVLIWVLLGALLAALVTALTAASTPRTPWRAAHVALSPVLALTLLLAPDILGVALTSVALLAWARHRPHLAGVLFGLAIAARSYPLLVLLAVLFVSVRAGSVRPAWQAIGIALGVAGGIAALTYALNPEAALLGYQSWFDAGAGYGSPWVAPQLLGTPIPSSVVTVLAIAGWGAAVVVGALFALSGPRRPGVAEVALVMVAIVLVTGKSFPVQSSLWLVPLVALAGARWRDHLLWAGSEALYFGAVWLYIAGLTVADRGLPAGWYLVFLLVRLAGLSWVVVQVARLARLRETFEADPAEPDQLAGPIAGLRDRLVVEVR